MNVAGPAERPPTPAIVAFLGSIFSSSIAYSGMTTSLGLQVYEISGRELDLGLLGMAQFAPSLLLVLVTGVVSDRFDRASVAFLGITGQATIALLLALYALSSPTSVGPIFLVVVLLGGARAFLAAAQGPLPADIVAPDRLPWLTARRALAARSGAVVGPILGGVLYVVEPSLTYLGGALVFVVAAALMWTVRSRHRLAARPVAPSTGGERGAVHEGLEGIRVIRRTRLLLGAISLDLFAVLFGGAIALLPALARDRLGVDAVGLGMLRAATGVGAMLVLLALAWRPVRQQVGRVLLLSIAVYGAGTMVLGLTTDFLVALLAITVLSGADSFSVFIRSNLVPLVTPVEVRGRVAAVNSVFIGASGELGAFESGVTGELLGASGAVVLGGVATLGIVGVYAVRFPELRTLDRFPSPTARPPDRGGLLRADGTGDARPLE